MRINLVIIMEIILKKNYNNYKLFLTPKGEKLRQAASNFIK